MLDAEGNKSAVDLRVSAGSVTVCVKTSQACLRAQNKVTVHNVRCGSGVKKVNYYPGVLFLKQ